MELSPETQAFLPRISDLYSTNLSRWDLTTFNSSSSISSRFGEILGRKSFTISNSLSLNLGQKLISEGMDPEPNPTCFNFWSSSGSLDLVRSQQDWKTTSKG